MVLEHMLAGPLKQPHRLHPLSMIHNGPAMPDVSYLSGVTTSNRKQEMAQQDNSITLQKSMKSVKYQSKVR